MRQPDPKNVRDALLSAGYSDEDVEVMLEAASGKLQGRVALRVAVAVREALVQRLSREVAPSRPWLLNSGLELAVEVVGRVDLTPIVDRLSHRENTGASTPRLP